MLKIRTIADIKSYNNERVVLDVLDDDNAHFYLVMDTTYNKNHTISNELRHTYWFFDQKVKKGDVVVLYTKNGTNSSTLNPNGSTTYFYYWNLGKSIWNDDGDGAVLFHISEWTTKRVQ
jgi:hypothetical protein